MGVAEATELRLIEHVLCPICMLVIYKCVALMPCFHNFCSACYSDWMGCKSDCPVCRQGVRAVIKNRAMDEVIEALLEASPDNRRSPEEVADMDRRDMLKLGRDGNLVHEMKPPPQQIPAVVPAAAPAAPAPEVASAAPAASAPASAGTNVSVASQRRPSGSMRTAITCAVQ